MAIKLIERDFDKVAKVCRIAKKTFIELLRFCLQECNYFRYGDQFYRQVNGLFMGSSLAPILVERVIEEAISTTLDKIDCTPDFWSIYVDDNMTCIPPDKANIVLDTLNSFHPRVQFTMELETEGLINFLDMTLIKRGSTISSKWYHKAISSNRMLNYYSAHARHTTLNTAKAFVERAIRLTSRRYHHEIMEKARYILAKNNFPAKLISNIIGQTMASNVSRDHSMHLNRTFSIANSTIQSPSTANLTLNETQNMRANNFAALSYVPVASEVISKQLRYFVPDVKLASKPVNKNQRFFTNTKSRLKKEDKNGCIYQIPCGDCNMVYIGETKQKLGIRLSQHKNDVRAKKDATALAAHARVEEHIFKFDECRILARERNKTRLQIQEVNHIICNDHRTCNLKTDSSHINPTYYCLLKNQCSKASPPAPSSG